MKRVLNGLGIGLVLALGAVVSLGAAGLLEPQAAVQDQSTTAQPPDTKLVLTNGAEVTGRLVELRDGQYTVDLSDGRRMQYVSSEVERFERIDGSTTKPEPGKESCNKVLVTEATVDAKYYKPLKKVEVSRKFYGSTDESYSNLAFKAAKLEADAIVAARQWFAPSGFAWATPHAGGLAVKWNDEGRAFAKTLEGFCYGPPK